eukprot:TRINITY_DN29531_c0_g1_i2.p1 TRINITY_DN29531_c0_g1~~TRINITY_DN29531_c0_g1_i2.p1  ORF type:complete len:133 (-),score=19.78 TRINITY_DN29531_c0_g1_i2:187-585(-)
MSGGISIVVGFDFFFFFFKQKTAYEMQRGLVGSEMCIRDRSSQIQNWSPSIMQSPTKYTTFTLYTPKIPSNAVVCSSENQHCLFPENNGQVLEKEIKKQTGLNYIFKLVEPHQNSLSYQIMQRKVLFLNQSN